MYCRKINYNFNFFFLFLIVFFYTYLRNQINNKKPINYARIVIVIFFININLRHLMKFLYIEKKIIMHILIYIEVVKNADDANNFK